MDYFDRLMFEYYKVLNNAWKDEIKKAAHYGIQSLADIPKNERVNKKYIDNIIDITKTNLGEDFMAEVAKPNKIFVDRCVRLGISDVNNQLKGTKVNANIGISIGLNRHRQQKLINAMSKQNLQWIGKHYSDDISVKFKSTLTEAIQSGYTRAMLADKFKEMFKDLGDKSSHYWQGLAEHTALRIREFARLEGYKASGAKYYKLLVILDERTSDICRALAKEDKVYRLDTAIEVMEELQALDPSKHSLETVRDRIKEIAPFINEAQVQRDKNGEPIGVEGGVTTFPPFHWKCRTTTRILVD